MKAAVLPFSQPKAEPDEPRAHRELPEHQVFVSQAWKISDEVGGERIAPKILLRARRRLFDGDSKRMLLALDAMADVGQLSVSARYGISVLYRRAARMEFKEQQPPSAQGRQLAVGDRDRSGKYEYRGPGDWVEVAPARRSRSADPRRAIGGSPEDAAFYANVGQRVNLEELEEGRLEATPLPQGEKPK